MHYLTTQEDIMITFPALSIEATLARVAQFNTLVGFGLKPEDFERLKNTAPEWPSQPGHIRTLRLRKNAGHILQNEQSPEDFMRWHGMNYEHLSPGEIARLMNASYENGVFTQHYIPSGFGGSGKTLFDQHVSMIRAVLHERFFITTYLADSTVDYAPVYGYSICRPDDVSWVVINLFAHAQNADTKKLYAAQGWIDYYRHACADELLAALWIYPEAFTLAVETLGGDAAWRATGYETSHDIAWGPMWSGLSLDFDQKTSRFFLSDSDSCGFVPEIVLT